jgi:NADH:ubiquinone oxidoreductase subunit 4 (subunit M)
MFLLNFVILFVIFCFLIYDLFIFYILFEALLIPMFLIIILYGSRERKIIAAYKFFLYTFIGSISFFIYLFDVYIKYSTFNL